MGTKLFLKDYGRILVNRYGKSVTVAQLRQVKCSNILNLMHVRYNCSIPVGDYDNNKLTAE